MELKTILNRPYKMLALGMLVLLAICFVGFATAKKQISVLADGGTINVETRATSVSGALKDAGVTLGKNDGYFLVNKKRLEEGAIIEIVRAMPVKVWQDGTMTEYKIGRATVKEVLQALNIRHRDRLVYPSPETRVVAGMEISILEKNTLVEEKQRIIPYSVEKRPDSHLPLGAEQVIAPGVNGEENVQIAVENVGGKIIKREIGAAVVKSPQNEIVAVGTGKIIETSRGATRYAAKKIMEASAYTIHEGSGTGLTSIGLVPRHGIIAVDPNVIPYGTKVYIPGYGFAVAGDCGGAIVGNRIDLFMDNYREAIQFGRRNVEMYILE
ncbi:MAG TPA: G5 domain-containing protein [Candidatus Avacidaminococcus intestinavium]|uniref:G5 domain-containing protein n=1 Tax=Candidatus Avacidaminococcus intestinavium TaxID=2840684 RepID=A0A9D1MR59_9FIRM|nr:G5 domain-containing protein [Candidatus Avacidaminococcus intestinavium]